MASSGRKFLLAVVRPWLVFCAIISHRQLARIVEQGKNRKLRGLQARRRQLFVIKLETRRIARLSVLQLQAGIWSFFHK